MPTWTAGPRDCCGRTTRFRQCKCQVEGIMFIWFIRTARFMQERYCRRWRYLAVCSGGGWRDPNIQHPNENLQASTSNLQRSTRHQNPNPCATDALELGIWSFFGAWMLMLGAFTLWHLPILFGTGLIAGFVDSIAGGGGLITLPVLLSLGLGPQQALGTNKLQASFGSGSAAWHYAQAGAVPLKDCIRGFVLTIIGAALGTLVVQQIHPDALKRMLPILILAVALYVLFKPQLGAQDHPP